MGSIVQNGWDELRRFSFDLFFCGMARHSHFENLNFIRLSVQYIALIALSTGHICVRAPFPFLTASSHSIALL
jgi:hypothetical protein